LGSLTVFENLMLAPLKQSGERLFPAIFKRRHVRKEEREAARMARQILERINLWKLADVPASSLSGGQKKLLELGRALMQKPRLILLDEPAAGVAPPLVLEFMQLVRELSAKGITFGIVEHDMRLISELCDNVYVLAEGRTLAGGTFEAVTGDNRVIDAYLGQAA
jgi:ABC-type branched-subunit amino acid transport system ATPase component